VSQSWRPICPNRPPQCKITICLPKWHFGGGGVSPLAVPTGPTKVFWGNSCFFFPGERALGLFFFLCVASNNLHGPPIVFFFFFFFFYFFFFLVCFLFFFFLFFFGPLKTAKTELVFFGTAYGPVVGRFFLFPFFLPSWRLFFFFFLFFFRRP